MVSGKRAQAQKIMTQQQNPEVNWLPAPLAGVKGQLTFDQIAQLLAEAAESRDLKLNRDTVEELEVGNTSFYVRRSGSPEYTFNEDAAPEAIFDGCRLSISDAQGFPCVFELRSVDVV